MSSLLEEAIVDATALKEAALKNAENVVLEKYSTEVKKALDTLLEQNELEVEGGATAPDVSFTESAPLAFQNEELNKDAAEELIEINFDELRERIAQEEAAGVEATAADLTDAGEMAEAITKTDIAADTSEDVASLDPQYVGISPQSPGRQEDDDDSLDEDEDIALTEEMLADLVEELVVDMTPRPEGWSSQASAYNSIVQANNDAMAAAANAHLQEDEELEEEVATAPDVVPDDALFELKVAKLTESTKELRALLLESKHQLTKLNLENAKLVYQNKALNSSSLNERQKNQIVEAVQSANSVEEANMIFETIQNAVGISSSKNSSRPQTLREAVQRPVSLLINSKRNNEVTKDPKLDRMLRLAGLNK